MDLFLKPRWNSPCFQDFRLLSSFNFFSGTLQGRRMLSCRETRRREIHHEISHCRCLGFLNPSCWYKSAMCATEFIPYFWSQWEVLRRVWILMSRPKHRVWKREDFSDNQESKQWSYWSTRYQAERRFWKIVWTHSSHVHHVFTFQGVFSRLFTFSQDVHDISNTFHGIHRFILVHLIRLQAPSGLWLTETVFVLQTRSRVDLSKFYIHWICNQLFDWGYHDQNDFKIAFQKILCFATPMERNIDSRTSTLALAQQFPRFVGWRFCKSEAGQGDVRFTIDSFIPPDQVFWSKSSLRAWLTCAFYES